MRNVWKRRVLGCVSQVWLVGERVLDSTKNSIQVMRPEKAVGRGDVERVKLAKYQIFRGENKRL